MIQRRDTLFNALLIVSQRNQTLILNITEYNGVHFHGFQLLSSVPLYILFIFISEIPVLSTGSVLNGHYSLFIRADMLNVAFTTDWILRLFWKFLSYMLPHR